MRKEQYWRPKRRSLLDSKMNTNDYYWENPNDPRNLEENEFYTTKGENGTIVQETPEKPKVLTIPEIKDKSTAAQKMVDDLTNVHLDTIVNGGTDSQIYLAKQNLDNAKKEVENYDLELTAAYGLGQNGYWNKAKELDMIVNEASQQKPMTTVQKTTPQTVQSKPWTAPMTNAELDNLVNNPQGYKPQTRQTREVKPKTTTTATPSTKSTVPATHLDLEIAQTLDEFVNNPGMSENRKDELNTQLSKLTADRDVLRWKATQPGSPTIENYETQEEYVTNEKNLVLDDIVSGIGNGSLVEGTEQWYAAHKKVSDLDNQLRALQMGKMGQLDGERAVSAQEQVAAGTRSGGGQMGDMSFSAENGQPQYVGLSDIGGADESREEKYIEEEQRLQEDIAYNETLTAKLPADESLTESERRDIDEQLAADIAYNDAMQASQFGTQLEADKQAEKDAAITQLDTQMAEEIALFNNLKNETYQTAYDTYEEKYHDPTYTVLIEGQIKSALNIYDLSGYTEEQLKQAFAESSWILDPASQISKDEFSESIIPKYDGMKEDALAKIDDKYFALERIGELEENPDISFFDWEGSGLDVREQLDGYQGKLEQLTTVYDKKWAEYYTLSGDEQIEMGYEIKKLDLEMKNMETLISDTNIALDYDIDMGDLNLTQLVLRAQDMFYNQVNAIADDSISGTNVGWDKAIELWKEGDDTGMKLIVKWTYGGEKDLDDIEDFNVLREDYYFYNGPWSGQLEAQKLLLEQESEVIDIIEPYFIKAVNYDKTDDGFTIILPTNLVFAMDYAKRMESDYDRDGNITDNVTHAASSAVGLVPVVGDAAAAGISLFGKILSDQYGIKEDMWDDAIARYDTLIFADSMEEPYIKFEWNEKESDFENLEWWSEI